MKMTMMMRRMMTGTIRRCLESARLNRKNTNLQFFSTSFIDVSPALEMNHLLRKKRKRMKLEIWVFLATDYRSLRPYKPRKSILLTKKNSSLDRE